ncbi:hypothetical protein POM88_002287 [Heracleum sosnowskyi]|uniref:Uncharacterized protein n=1 Tax=Heracleum sosnowskyi TaxID=360622 RepID=A0AAD8JE36_9APIA|nr:hypothetical protein POM88_002287 [Heracleum sosnowskyi]
MRQKAIIKVTNDKSAVKLTKIAALCTGIGNDNKSVDKLMKIAALCTGIGNDNKSVDKLTKIAALCTGIGNDNKSADKLTKIAALCTGIGNDNKSVDKLMKIAAACCNGVESVALKGDGRDLIEITGEGIDAIRIAKMMCRKGRRADLMCIGPAKNEVHASSTSGINEGSMVVMQPAEPIAYPVTPSYPVYETVDHDPHCNVMLIAVCIFQLTSSRSPDRFEVSRQVPKNRFEVPRKPQGIEVQDMDVMGQVQEPLRWFRVPGQVQGLEVQDGEQ